MKTFGRKNVSSLCFIFLLSMLVLSLCACSTGTNSGGDDGIKNVPVTSLVL